MKNSAREQITVVQWATGNVGMHSLKKILEHPDLDLVGLYVHSLDKVGRDAGELCGRPPVGIKATNEINSILELRPDCVVYMPLNMDLDEVAQILRSGANVVTTKGEFQNPKCMTDTERKLIEDACREGKSSVHSTGSSPGFATDGLPLLLATLQRHLECMTVDEFADMSSRNSPAMMKAMGFGQLPSHGGSAHLVNSLTASRRRSFYLIADAVGLPIDDVIADIEIGTALKATKIAAGVIEAGTIAGLRISISGIRNGKPILRFRANWYVTKDMDVSWDLLHSGWRVFVEGDTPLDVTITFPVPLDEYPLVSPGLTAHPAVNAIRAVCEAPFGIRTSLDLSTIIPRFE